jgi:hypothetical protein
MWAQTITSPQAVRSCRRRVGVADSDRGKRTLEFAEKNFGDNIFFWLLFFHLEAIEQLKPNRR